MNYLNIAVDWVKARVAERTSWDGATIVVVCGLVVLTGGLVKWVAWAGLIYGVYTLVKAE
jgi:hypothetical protein